MRVNVENTGPIGRRMSVAVPAEEVEKEVVQRLSELARKVRLPGFRPGKAPRRVVESRFGGQVLQEVAGDLINESFRRALGEQGLNPAGGPSIEDVKAARGEDLEYVASFDVFPEISNPSISGRAVNRPKVEITESDIDRTIEKIRKGRAEYQPASEAAKEGDRVTIDYHGSMDGEPFDGGHGHDFAVVIGSGNLLKGFEDQLLGRRPGESHEFDLDFPAEYPNHELAGKRAHFQITVKSVEQPVLPEVNEQFIRSFGVEDGTVDSLRAEVRQNLGRELADRMRSHVRGQVLEALWEGNAIPLPQRLVEDEITRMVEAFQAGSRRGRRVPAPEMVDHGVFEPEARRRVALALLARKVVEDNKIEPEAAAVRSRIEEMAAGYEQPEQFVQWYYSDRARLSQVESMVVEDRVVEALLADADVQEPEKTLEEFMNQLSAQYAPTPT